jgi:predicted phage terminase large subunit-like protein
LSLIPFLSGKHNPSDVLLLNEYIADAETVENRIRYENSLSEFVKDAWHAVDPSTYQESWVIDAVCDHLMAVSTGDIKRLLVNVPPRTGKTTVISILYPMWTWIQPNADPDEDFLRGPHVRFLCASYDHFLAMDNSNKSRRLVYSPWFQKYWPDRIHLQVDQNAKAKWDNTFGGSRQSTSVAGGLLGRGGDVLIGDDLNDTQVEGGESDADRKSVATFWREFSTTRLNNQRRGAIINVQQRTHTGDVSGIIMGGQEDYVQLVVPMRYDATRHCVTVVLPQYDDDEPWQDPRSVEGELMWPERFNDEEIRRMEIGLGKYMAAGRLQQRPVPAGGGIIQWEWWKPWDQIEARSYGLEWGSPPCEVCNGEKTYTTPSGRLRLCQHCQGTGEEPGKIRKEFPDFDLRFASLDTAFGEKEENDYSALTVWGVWLDKNKNRRLMLMYAWNKRLPLHGRQLSFDPGTSGDKVRKAQDQEWGLVELVADTCKRYKVHRLLIEDKSRGTDVSNELHRLYARENFGIMMINPTRDKVSRCHSVVPMFADNMIYCPETAWSDKVREQMSEFPKADHDDLVDSCLTGSTGIVTTRGIVSIAEVICGDLVLTHKGRWRKVLRTGSRISDHYYRVKAKGLDQIEITGEHPFLTMRVRCPQTAGKECVGTAWKATKELVARPTYAFRRNGKLVQSQRRVNHDALVIPRLAGQAKDRIDLAEVWGDTVTHDDHKIYHKRAPLGRFSFRDAENIILLAQHREQKEIAEMYGVSTGMISLIVKGKVGPLREKQHQDSVGRFISLDREAGWVFGLYAAEGCVSKHSQVKWSCDYEAISRIQTWINSTFGKSVKITKGNGCYSVVLSSLLVTPIFMEFGYLAENKIVPQWALDAPLDFVQGFIDGYSYGDGCAVGNRIALTSTSQSLLWGVRLMLARLGIPSWYQIDKEEGPRKVFGRMSECLEAYRLDYAIKAKHSGAVVSEDYIGTHIEKIERVNEKAIVYNLSVEEDESYVTVGGTVHNCTQALNWFRESGLVYRADEATAMEEEEATWRPRTESVAAQYGV